MVSHSIDTGHNYSVANKKFLSQAHRWSVVTPKEAWLSARILFSKSMNLSTDGYQLIRGQSWPFELNLSLFVLFLRKFEDC